jgi:hypothetical protein
MAKPLVDVINLDDYGLVGFNEIGEEIPLTYCGEGHILNLVRERVLMNWSSGDYYFLFEKRKRDAQHTHFKIYTKRDLIN